MNDIIGGYMPLYDLFRIITELILFIVLIVIPVILRKNKKMLCNLIYITIFIFVSITLIFPYENLIIDFPTTESVFSYTRTGQIITTLDGNNSSLIISSNGNSYSESFIRKNDRGFYKIMPAWNEKIIAQNNENNNVCSLYQIKHTSDYYLCGTYSVTKDKNIKIEDNYNTNFFIYSIPIGETGMYSVIYYAVLNEMPKNYTYTISGKEYSILYE